MAIQRSQGPGKKTRAFVVFTLRYGKLLWAIAILLAIPATWRTVKLYANLKSDLEELLPRKCFARVHKQAIVNLEKLAVLDPIAKGGITARLRSGETIEISRRHAQDLRQRLGW